MEGSGEERQMDFVCACACACVCVCVCVCVLRFSFVTQLKNKVRPLNDLGCLNNLSLNSITFMTYLKQKDTISSCYLFANYCQSVQKRQSSYNGLVVFSYPHSYPQLCHNTL